MSRVKVTLDFMYFDQQLTKKLDKVLRATMENILEDAVKQAKEKAPEHIGNFIERSQVTKKESAKSIRYMGNIYVLLSNAPDARAWEKGSGLHAERNPGKYPIEAKNAPMLNFYWEKEQVWFYGKKVNHPGIKAKPYLRPALLENKVKYWRWVRENIYGK